MRRLRCAASVAHFVTHLAALALAVVTSAAFAAPGALDTTFGAGTGKVITAVGAGNDNANGMAIQPDGKIVLAGGCVNGANNDFCIARYNTDGTLDTTFDPNANNLVYATAVQADGKVLVCGNFTNIGGQTRNHIARLDAVTGAADSFDPNANAFLYSAVTQDDGKILVSGSFTSIGGQIRTFICFRHQELAGFRSGLWSKQNSHGRPQTQP